jgi:hypothetical protein
MTAVQVATTRQVIITETAEQVVEVLVPQAPAVVNVITEGPQGPAAGASEVRVDAATAGTIYVGIAVNGTAESATAWTITRSTYSAAGLRTSKLTATAVTWTGRVSHSYT